MIYLMQHGEALSKDEDPERPLTDLGTQDADNLAALLHDAGVEIDDILDSGKLRARQTAEALARQLAPESGPEAMDGLGANDPVEPIVDQAAGWTRRVALVGHMPFVAHFAGALVNGDPERSPVSFVPGTMVALQYEANAWRIAWMIRPELLR